MHTDYPPRRSFSSAGAGTLAKLPVMHVQEIKISSRSKPKRKKSSQNSKHPESATNTSQQASADLLRGVVSQDTMAPTPPTVPQCPALNPEFQSIHARHKTLVSTGCTAQICQAGRMVHTDEPRVGENRALRVVEQDARDFLEELHRDGFFGSDEAFCERLRQALKEIRTGATNGIIRQDSKHGRIGGNWTQTPAELEFGLRRAWRNSRKCIMRSHCEELKLCDFRSITSSAEMATELIRGTTEAFNNGNIQPTVFVFPPRKAGSRGPMIWNSNMLSFAGYELENGSVLGDPMSLELTKAIIELGWTPPEPKSRWDVLPLVTMAEDDVPVIAELPPYLQKLVQIRHPRYGKEFETLDLKWVAFPALTRLGFDIGGVQYTATPFIGWFMDAEIGVRNLADSFRYNALPDIVQALGLADSMIGKVAESFEDLPEYERLSMLSRAQTELNYAVHWSFSQAKVNMSDSLTASMKWSRYDDEFKEKNGFRLPADPYWLAPPQGSIIPVWHRGGAPNYQPKPMICKHVQDPIKAWAREKPNWFISAKELNIVANLRQTRPKMPWRSLSFDSSYIISHGRLKHRVPRLLDEKDPLVIIEETEITPQRFHRSIEIYYCSAGTLAEKIATKLHSRTASLISGATEVALSPKVQPISNLEVPSITQGKIFLLVVSSTGKGEIPPNGTKIIDICQNLIARKQDNIHFHFAIYGNGDTRYSGTYNGAAVKIQQQLRRIGGRPIAGGLFSGDTAFQATAFQALSPWWTKLQPSLQDVARNPYEYFRSHSEEFKRDPGSGLDANLREETMHKFTTHSEQLKAQYHNASLVSISQQVQSAHAGSYLLTLDIGTKSYEDLGCIQVLPLNSPSKVRRVLRALGVSASALVPLNSHVERCPTYSRFLSEFADLEVPFSDLQWLKQSDLTKEDDLDSDALSALSVLEVLDTLQTRNLWADLALQFDKPSNPESALRVNICLAMPLLQPRNYSIASSRSYHSQAQSRTTTPPPSTHLQILIKPQPTGRFSSTFLTENPTPSPLKYRLVDSHCGPSLRTANPTPLVVVATGAGFAPVRCLLQRRIMAARSPSPAQEGSISLFLGLKPIDIPLVSDLLMEAAQMGILDSLSIVPSNEAKVRVYHRLEEEAVREWVRRKLVDEGGRMFVCAGAECAREVGRVVEEIMQMDMGGKKDVRAVLGGRWIEEVF